LFITEINLLGWIELHRIFNCFYAILDALFDKVAVAQSIAEIERNGLKIKRETCP